MSGAAPGGWVTELTDAVTQLRRVLRREVRVDVTWESLPMAQVELLQLLEESDGARVSDVAGALRLAANTVSTLVAQMSSAGMLRRSTDPQDRRAARLSLTETGLARLQEWRQAQELMLRAALGELTVRQRQTLLAAVPALRALTAALARGRPHAR
jgi:DNA-binding MarR family transcriptional regulator